MTETPANVPPPSGDAPKSQDHSLAMGCHLLGLVGFAGPLIIWLIKKDESAEVAYHGKEALNFQLTVLIAWLVSSVSICIGIGIVLAPAVLVANIIFCVLAAIKANEGVQYRYPVCIRFIK